MRFYLTFRRFVFLLSLLMASGQAAYAVSPYEQYYNQQQSAPVNVAPNNAAPVDNDQYYTAPGQYIPRKNYVGSSGQYTPSAPSKGCTTISDSPECLGD